MRTRNRHTLNKKRDTDVFGENVLFTRRKKHLGQAEQIKVKNIIIWTTCVVASILMAFLTIKFVVEEASIKDDSMAKILKKEDKILVNKLVYNFSSPRRFDVIVFKQKSKEKNSYNVKRIIALPGEKIKIKEGKVYVNNKVLKEKVDVDKCNNPGLAEEEKTLGKNEYFVLGDNRNSSEDSRFANIGIIKKDDIVGEAAFILSTFSFVGR